MRAIQFDRYGPPAVLHPAEVPEPAPGPGEVRVRVRAAGVNPFDTKLRSGLFAAGPAPAAPVIPGLEAAGVVDAVGAGVAGVAAGDEVFGHAKAAYAEAALLRTWARRPAGLGWAGAAGLPVAVATATRVLGELDLPAGRVLLVHGAAGGVGQAAVQLARQAGLRVVGTAGERNHDLLRGLGVEPVAYGPGLTDRVSAILPDGVDGVLDAAGSQLDDLLALAGGPGSIVTIANYGAGERGVRVSRGGGDDAAALAAVVPLVEAGRFRLRVAATFPLEEAAAAHELSESRTAAGKIVLTVD